jgi:hypothetical protein
MRLIVLIYFTSRAILSMLSLMGFLGLSDSAFGKPVLAQCLSHLG